MEVASLAAGGDGVARDATGRVTFVPRTAPGDRVRARIVQATTSFARAELVSVEQPGPSRVAPACPAFTAGCGGCQWQHVARSEQLAAKAAIVASALRKLVDLTVHPIDAAAPALGWRRRARFHVAAGVVGLYADGSHRIVPLAACPQLEPRLDAALAQVARSAPPDGELALVLGYAGDVAIGTEAAWPAAARLVGEAGIVGIEAGPVRHGAPVIELEPGLYGGPWDFAQASAAGNQQLIARVREAVGRGPGSLVELYAGAGNLSRGLVGDGWAVTATDGVSPPRPIPGLARPHLAGPVADVLRGLPGPCDALVLDPPRAGAPDAIEGIVRLAPRVIAYVSCDVATLGRDAAKLASAGYRATDAWPIDLMPQTSHVEVVLRLIRP